MKKFKGTAWTGKPNFKKIMRERREKNILGMIVLILYGLLLWFIFFK